MEWAEFLKIVSEQGLGFASFVALIIFIFKYQTKANMTLEEISKTLIQLSERVDKLEEKVDDRLNERE